MTVLAATQSITVPSGFITSLMVFAGAGIFITTTLTTALKAFVLRQLRLDDATYSTLAWGGSILISILFEWLMVLSFMPSVHLTTQYVLIVFMVGAVVGLAANGSYGAMNLLKAFTGIAAVQGITPLRPASSPWTPPSDQSPADPKGVSPPAPSAST